MIERALISVFDKTGIVDLCGYLREGQIHLLATEGTSNELNHLGLEVLPISVYTGFPKILDGRVKTLHPKIYGGILANRHNKLHAKQLQQYHISYIDLVVINLYPFEKVVLKGESHKKIIEMIDIGGVSLMRAAAKNYEHTIILCHPNDYTQFIDEHQQSGSIGLDTRLYLANKAFKITSQYDSDIAQYFSQKVDSI